MVEFPVTQAVRVLRAAQVSFVPHVFAYEERGGKRGFLVAITPSDLRTTLSPLHEVEVAIVP